jgi:MFS family permease
MHEAILRQDPALELAAHELPAELTRGSPTLAGRGAELERLRAAWHEARDGCGRVVLVTGVRGIGKTRLIGELAGELHTDASGVAWTLTGYLLAAAICTPVFGRLGDTMRRWVIVGGAVLVWSLATGGTGLATGYLVLLSVREVLIPRLVEPIGTGSASLLLWPAALLVLAMVGSAWLPRAVVAVPVAVLVAATAAFALGGAVAGTLMPQLGAAVIAPGQAPAQLAGAAVGLVITVLVLLAFLHGAPRSRLLVGAAGTGRWLLLGGIGGWLGFLIVSRLTLLVDRVAFLLNGWIGIGR